MNFSSPDMIFLAEHHFFEINYQHKCVEPTKKCLFCNFDALPRPAWAAQPAGVANLFYMHMDMLIDHSDNKISLGGWPSLGVFLCHCMLRFRDLKNNIKPTPFLQCFRCSKRWLQWVLRVIPQQR